MSNYENMDEILDLGEDRARIAEQESQPIEAIRCENCLNIIYNGSHENYDCNFCGECRNEH